MDFWAVEIHLDSRILGEAVTVEIWDFWVAEIGLGFGTLGLKLLDIWLPSLASRWSLKLFGRWHW